MMSRYVSGRATAPRPVRNAAFAVFLVITNMVLSPLVLAGTGSPGYDLAQELSGDFDGLAEQTDPRFGYSVAMFDDTLAIGAPGTRVGGTNNRGAVFVFRREGDQWQQTQRILPAVGTGGGQCGYSVALDANNLLIGCPFQSYDGMERGRARLYTRSNPTADFVLAATFDDLGTISGAECGRSVSLLGAADSGSFPFLAIACPGRGFDQGGGVVTRPGAVDIHYWLFDWVHAATITPAATSPTRFGESIELASHFGDLLLAIGRPGTSNGQVLVYAMGETVSEWDQEHVYTGTSEAEFGHSVHLAGANNFAHMAIGDPTHTVVVHDGQDFVNVPVGAVTVAARLCLPNPNPPHTVECNWQPSTDVLVGSPVSGTGAQNRLGHVVHVFEPGRLLAGEPRYHPDDPKGRARHYFRQEGSWVLNQAEPFFQLPNLGNFLDSEFGLSLAANAEGWLAIGAPGYWLGQRQSHDPPAAPLGGSSGGRVFIYQRADALFSDRFEEQ